MSMPRGDYFINSLQRLKNQGKLELYAQETHTKIADNLANRMFDKAPIQIESTKLTRLTSMLEFIVTQAKIIDTTTFDIDSNSKYLITAWLERIIATGINELLDQHNQIKTEIVDLLGWREFKERITPGNLICAYVGSVNQLISQDLIYITICHANKDKQPGVVNYISKYGKMVDDMLTWSRDKIKLKAGEINLPLPRPPANIHLKTIVAVGALATLGIFALTMTQPGSIAANIPKLNE